MTQEIGIVEAVEGLLDVSANPVGSHLRIIPYHVSTIPLLTKRWFHLFNW